MSKEISCLKCKSLWIAIVIGIIAVILIGIGIFNFKFYSDNYYNIADGLRYSLLILIISLSGYFSYYNIRKFCSKPYSIEHGGNGGSIENLVWGVILAVNVIAFLMIGYNYLPITIQEWQVRFDDYSMDSILKLDCNVFEMNKGDYPNVDTYEQDNRAFRSDELIAKLKECGL